MSNTIRIIGAALVFGLLLGITDAWIDSVLFYEGSFWDLLLTDVPGNEILSRTVTLIIMLIFGLISAVYYEKAVASKEQKNAREAELKKLIDSTLAVPWKLEIASQKFVFMGERLTQLTGYKPAEMADFESWASKIHPEDRDFVVNFCRTATKKNIDHELVYRMMTSAGKAIWIRDLVFIEKENGKPIFQKGFFFDITKPMEMEAEKKHLEAQLHQAQKMEALGQLAGGVAHDFNNFLTTIVGYGELSLMNMAEDDPNRENVDEILSAANKASSVTRSLLVFSRKQVINPKPIDINEVVTGMQKLLERALGENIELSIKTSPERIIAKADSGQLEQVIINMAANAAGAIKDIGTFSIEVSKTFIDEKSARTCDLDKAGPYAAITFSDNGEGMDAQTVEKIFEPFYTTKNKDQGTGLGLSIVHGIIKQNKGYINVYSEKGYGTTFKILLPCTGLSLPEKDKTDSYKIKGGDETVLIAEDEKSVRKLLAEILSSYGYKIILAEDGHDAVEKFRAAPREIKLVILDVIMPGQNGKDALTEIRGEYPGAKALFISGYAADIIQHKGLIVEDTQFLSKPILPNELLHLVRDILDDNTQPRQAPS